MYVQSCMAFFMESSIENAQIHNQNIPFYDLHDGATANLYFVLE